MDDIYLEDLIATNYDELLNDVLQHGHSNYILKGGRGSIKSSFIGFSIPLLMLEHPDVSALIVRKTGKTLRDSVFSLLLTSWDWLMSSYAVFLLCRLSGQAQDRSFSSEVWMTR